MSERVTVHAAVISHIGCVRKNNEDNFYFDGDMMRGPEVDQGVSIQATTLRPSHLFAVCDGMGGLNNGEVASMMAVEALKKLDGELKGGELESQLRRFAIDTSLKIFEDGKQRGSQQKQGTTLALLLIRDGAACVANVGDSRVYLLRLGRLVQLTMDHTLVYKQMLRGELTQEQMRKHPTGNLIYQFLGQPKDQLKNDYMFERGCALCNGDRFMICSDGLSDLVPHETLERICGACSDPMEAARQMVGTALELGGKDNVTCIVGDVSAADLPIQTQSDLDALDAMPGAVSTCETTAMD